LLGNLSHPLKGEIRTKNPETAPELIVARFYTLKKFNLLWISQEQPVKSQIKNMFFLHIFEPLHIVLTGICPILMQMALLRVIPIKPHCAV
jgi:hypothetical protein